MQTQQLSERTKNKKNKIYNKKARERADLVSERERKRGSRSTSRKKNHY